jgi:cytochrome b561
MQTSERYTPVAMTLHWVMALGILSTFAFGLYMQDLPLSPDKLRYYSWHKWAGVTLFLLVLFRVFWRITHKPPAPPGHMPRWQVLAADGAHHALYLLMLAIPLSGWLMSSAKGFQTVWFGVVPLPDLLAKDKELGNLLQLVHMSLNYLMIAIIAAHIGAALKHHLIDRDDVLKRMLPFPR